MSFISPEKLFEEVEPYDVERYCSFVKEYVVPLHVLAKEYAKNFEGDMSANAAKYVVETSEKVLNLIKERNLCNVDISYSIPNDILELGRELLEYAANIFLGVGEAGKLTFFVYSLRHLPAEYIYALYPKLEEEQDIRNKIFNLLGIKVKFEPPIEGLLVNRLRILGYIDYPMLCVVSSNAFKQVFRILLAQSSTLGGSIGRLIDAIAFMLRRPGLLNAYELSVDVLDVYIKSCLSLVGTDIEHIYPGVYTSSFSEKYIRLDHTATWDGDWSIVLEGLAMKCASRIDKDKYETGLCDYESNLLSELRRWAPGMALGIVDPLIGYLGRFILFRWIVWKKP